MVKEFNGIKNESTDIKEEHIDDFVDIKYEELFTLPIADVSWCLVFTLSLFYFKRRRIQPMNNQISEKNFLDILSIYWKLPPVDYWSR